jgi:phosphatidate cytidylyltransferase
MKQRAITAGIITLIFIPLLLFNVLLIPFKIVIGLLAMIAVYELIRMFEREKEVHWLAKVAIFFFTAGFYVIVGNLWENDPNILISDLSMDISLILLPAILILFTLSVFIPNFGGKSLGLGLLIISYVGLGFGSLAILRVLGSRYVVYLLLTTVSTDTFAFLFGIKFGKHKMAPTISPKKSWEGAIAGTILGTTLGSLFGILYFVFPEGTILNPTGSMTILDGITTLGNSQTFPSHPIMWQHVLIIIPITLLISIFGQLGDLFASKLKRTYEIKDFGSIFPGHGGVLDRFDSVIFSGMFLVFIFKVMSILWPVA